MAKQAPTTVNTEVDPPTGETVPERVISGAVSNPTFIDWPHDPFGFTSMLRKEGVRAIGRVSGNQEKAEILLGTLQCLAQHLKARLPDQQSAIEQRLAAAGNREAAERHLSLADARRNVERIKGALAYAETQAAALEGGAQ
jgi:hypothetical protein